jgi:hypothetical protein
VPIHAQPGRGGGIVLGPGWRTTLAGLSGLTTPEARSVPLAGLGSAARDLGLGVDAADVQLKLLARLPPDAAADASRIAERFHIDPLPWYFRPEVLPLLPALAAAVWQGRRIRVRYDSWKGASERTLAPLGLVLEGGLWYLVAAEAGRGRAPAGSAGSTGRGAPAAHAAPRTYRASGIQTLRELPETAVRPAGFVLAAHWPEAVAAFEARLMAGRATVRLTAEALRILRAEQPSRGRTARGLARGGTAGRERAFARPSRQRHERWRAGIEDNPRPSGDRCPRPKKKGPADPLSPESLATIW